MTGQDTGGSALPAPVDRALLDAAGQIVADVRCHRCHYNLRTLPASGQCPECAEPCTVSLRRWRLNDAPASYLRALTDGAGGLRTACVFAALCCAALTLLGAPLPPRSVLADLVRVLLALLALLAACLGVGLVIVGLWGALRLTARDPRQEGHQGEGWTPRRTSRWALVLALPGALATVLAMAWGHPTHAQACALLTAEFMFVALPVLLLEHAAALLGRATHAGARGAARLARVGSQAFVALPVAAVVVLGLARGMNASGAEVVLLTGVGVGYVAAFAIAAGALGRAEAVFAALEFAAVNAAASVRPVGIAALVPQGEAPAGQP